MNNDFNLKQAMQEDYISKEKKDFENNLIKEENIKQENILD